MTVQCITLFTIPPHEPNTNACRILQLITHVRNMGHQTIKLYGMVSALVEFYFWFQ